ncbi:MAG: alpha/beta hydrolase [Chloroflexi bacterium]|nr:alpha/beta hydrolase [Chloroflexota bacterium]
MPFLSTPRGRFFYRLKPGNEPTLLFLHGNLGTSAWWQPVLDSLPPDWQGIALDALGYGRSDRCDHLERYSVPALMQDLNACVEALALERVHLVAHSTATPVAINYALAFADRVASLTLVGPVPTAGVSTPPEAYPLLERLPGDEKLRRQALQASLPSLDPDSKLWAQFAADLAEIEPMALVAIARGLDLWRPGQQLRELTLPVLLLRGDEDIMLSDEEARLTLLSIPGASNLEVFRGVGHSPMVERPQAFKDVLVEFIAEDWDDYNAVRASAAE